MLSFIVIGLAAFLFSAMTLFSGFGLGTLLMPAFALFFPIPVAVAATAVVHVLNNLFKLALLYRHAIPRIVIVFGLPAVGTAFLGALLLTSLSDQSTLATWELGSHVARITPLKLTMGLLILGFAAIEFLPLFDALRFGKRWLPLGGALSGFFGGLSGHQGALRAAFLVPLGLKPQAFAATQAVLACLVDVARIAVYGAAFFVGRAAGITTTEQWRLVAVATACAFAGAYVGKLLLPKVTFGLVRALTGALLLLVGSGMTSGLL